MNHQENQKMIDWNKYRGEFPHLQNRIYLNHAAISPQNLRAKAAMENFWKDRLENNIGFWPDAIDRKDELKEKISRLINAGQEQIALVANTSAGLNILAGGLKWRRGDRILLNDFEFPSNVIPFLNLQRLGVQVDFVRHRNGEIRVEDILQKIKPRTRLISISFVEFLNGFRNDLKTIGEICRERGIIFSVDAIQGLGALKLDVENFQIDFLSSGGHKWLMWPAGLGFVYISSRIFDHVYPAQAGWLSVKTPWNFFDYRQGFAPGARRFECGTFNTGAIISANATLEMMLEIGPEEIEKKILENTDLLMRELSNMGFELFSPLENQHRSGIVTFFHPDAENLANYLKQNRVTISLREGGIRVSPHFYNNETDLESFLENLSQFDKR